MFASRSLPNSNCASPSSPGFTTLKSQHSISRRCGRDVDVPSPKPRTWRFHSFCCTVVCVCVCKVANEHASACASKHFAPPLSPFRLRSSSFLSSAGLDDKLKVPWPSPEREREREKKRKKNGGHSRLRTIDFVCCFWISCPVSQVTLLVGVCVCVPQHECTYNIALHYISYVIHV